MERKEILSALKKAKRYYKKGGRYYDEKHKPYNSANKEENIMEHVNDILHCFGVEAIQGDNVYYPDYTYVNTGDPYCLTLMYSYKTNCFMVNDWGSIAEKTEKKTIE